MRATVMVLLITWRLVGTVCHDGILWNIWNTGHGRYWLPKLVDKTGDTIPCCTTCTKR